MDKKIAIDEEKLEDVTGGTVIKDKYELPDPHEIAEGYTIDMHWIGNKFNPSKE